MLGRLEVLSGTLQVRGSPPRVRGGQPRVLGSPCRGSDHPRVCGEHADRSGATALTGGSSPRVRGGHGRAGRESPAERITPACAGTTPKRPTMSDSRTDHPRVCGTTPEEIVPAIGEADHPRVCGDDPGQPVPHQNGSGSPPRVRGRLLGHPRGDVPPRITPACAGTTYIRLRRPRRPSDHPRVCGDDVLPAAPVTQSSGSPPRVRGRLGGRRDLLPALRITPACAGTTTLTPPGSWSAPDHPRVCGDDR